MKNLILLIRPHQWIKNLIVFLPVFAHLAWGREQNGFNFFFQAGPQLGLYLGESTSKNYDTPNLANDGFSRKIFIITIIVILKQYTQYLRIMNNW